MEVELGSGFQPAGILALAGGSHCCDDLVCAAVSDALDVWLKELL